MADPTHILVISHTHWDREWYRTYQEFRLRLVEVVDQVLDLLAERPDFAHFTLDGQAVILEDYLAIRPERASQVREFVQAGRLHIGPWYVQPDEFLVSGESLIRNLMLGERVARPLGGAARIGWLPDTFGHVAQLPQILRNFGIDNFVFTRGMGDELPEPRTEFWWEAPNGDRVLALHQLAGYWNAGNLGYTYFWGDTQGRAPDLELAARQVNHLLAELGARSSTSVIAVWNGSDHMPPQSTLPEIIHLLNGRLDGCTIRHASVQDYVQALLAARPDLPVVRGELRGSRYQNVHASILSTRIYLKQANHQTQRMLERQAEPLATCAWLLGQPYPHAQLWEAWRLLLQNHPHDSICGCSIDQVHREMMSRFDQAREIAASIADRSLSELAKHVDTGGCTGNSIPLVVFNPLGHARCEVVEASLRLPRLEPGYRVVDPHGQSGHAQILAHHLENYTWLPARARLSELLSKLAWWKECLRELDGLAVVDYAWQLSAREAVLRLRLGDWQFAPVDVLERMQAETAGWSPDTNVSLQATFHHVALAFLADVPACGYAVYALEGSDAPASVPSPIHASPSTLENEYVRVEAAPDGALTLIHKPTGWQAAGLHRFEDGADIGDTYDFCPLSAPGDPILLNDTPRLELVEHGELQATLAIHHTFRVPASLADDRASRSANRVDLPVTSRLRLRAGSRYLEIITDVENYARDHRLRAMFPTGITADRVDADGQFAVVSRPAVSAPKPEWSQPPSSLQPHHTWFAMDDGRSGLAVFSDGLPEHAAIPREEGVSLALTLFRGVGCLSRGDLSNRSGHAGLPKPTPDAQCLGAHQFRYAIAPYLEDPITAGIARLASEFDVPLIARPAPVNCAGWPPSQSLVSLEPGRLLLSALKCSAVGNLLVVRFYNPGTTPVAALLRFGIAVSEAWRATAAERIIGRLEVSPSGRECEVPTEAGEMVTLLLRPARRDRR